LGGNYTRISGLSMHQAFSSPRDSRVTTRDWSFG